ncbi:unnamed protein product [Callosobruchus maculatus]|uniref:Uncharacterized protein n=1 Tax=Callosobruchus maculatus TaxID=64391 RepID=A0A653D547_CALMS|nr:unnamed protein product [Callosobruchus maculatus]
MKDIASTSLEKPFFSESMSPVNGCCNRMKNIVKISGNKIYCGPECELDGNNVINSEVSSEITEKLKQELSDKERYIERLLKKAKDFETDVLEIEQRFIDEQTEYKEQLKFSKEKLYSLKSDFIRTQKENEKLTGKIDEYQKQIEKMFTQINELQKVNVDMLSSISILEKANDTYEEEIERLKTSGNSTLVRENAILGIDEDSRTEEDKGADFVNVLNIHPNLGHNINRKRKILVIGDEFAKNGSTVLHSIIPDSDITIEGIVKPSIEFSDLALSLFYYSQQYGKNDYIIIMLSTINISNFRQLNLALRHLLPLSRLTNLYVMSKRSHCDDFRVENHISKTVNAFFVKNTNISLRFQPNVFNTKTVLKKLAKEIVECTHRGRNIVLKVVETCQSLTANQLFRRQGISNCQCNTPGYHREGNTGIVSFGHVETLLTSICASKKDHFKPAGSRTGTGTGMETASSAAEP